MMQTTAESEIRTGNRFEFGANWARFLGLVDERRIAAAEASLKAMLGVDSFHGESFLDIGCGSGLFSLAARRLGARVHSFDFDPQSVACARELKDRYLPHDEHWHIEQGSVLDREYLARLGHFDIVYSWGVLHHTGAMWTAIENAIGCTARENGTLLIAIYNDQGWKSHAWWFVKRLYNVLPRFARGALVAAVVAVTSCIGAVKRALKASHAAGAEPTRGGARVRGMDVKRDWLDWIGGFPYEFASLATIESFLRARGFSPDRVRPTVGWGCNEICARRAICAD
jgi:2-polyprenyl-3-methyl-5-hydroxy-6-metoxy-1,4-benzoquinol methylase